MLPDETLKDRLVIKIGSTFSKSWPLTDADTGLAANPSAWSARCEVRTEPGGALITRFHTAETPWDGVITYDVDGNMTLTLDSTKTAALSPVSNAVFDIEMINHNVSPNTVTTVVAGPAYVIPEVTTGA